MMAQLHSLRTRRHQTIGYLGSSLVVEQPWQAGLIDAAIEHGVNLIIFSGSSLESPNLRDVQRSRIFELAGAEVLDGLIIGSDFLGHYSSLEQIRTFCEHYRPLPIVKYEPLVEGFPTLLFDFYQGMYELVSHLVEVHGCHKIAYINGPEQSRSIRDRFQAYQDVLAAHNIPFDERLTVTGPIAPGWGEEAVRIFLDERCLKPGTDIDAIVGFYDAVAVNALAALQRRGVHVPDEIALVGFDDDEVAFAAAPRLTTVRLPFYEIGRWGVDTVTMMLDGKAPPPVTTLPASLVIRQSCGCLTTPNFPLSWPEAIQNQEESTPWLWLQRSRDQILHLLLIASGIQNMPRFREDVKQLLDLLIAECGASMQQDLSTSFVEQLSTILGRMGSIHYNIEMIYAVFAVSEAEFLKIYTTDRERLWLHYLFQYARTTAGDIIERFLIAEKHQAAALDNLLHEISQEMATAVSISDLIDLLAQHLPRLGIPACYLSLYTDPDRITTEARLILAYHRKGRLHLPPNGRIFPARRLIPDGLRNLHQPTCLLVMPLFYREEQMGFVVFERGPQHGGLYEALCERISSTLKGIQLHESAVEARRRAEEANHLKSRFLSSVTHELRTPLSMIVSLSEMLLEDGEGNPRPLPDEFRQDLELIHATGRHLDRLVLDVLELGRSQLGQLPIQLKRLDLAELLEETALIGAQMAREKKLAWRAFVPATLPPVRGDRTRLQQILLNLLSNAVKFTPTGEVSFLVTVGEHEITIAVSDTGLGISQKEQGTIFDEFYQSERTSARGYGGMGLGLAITRRLVEMHGGRISLISSGEEGQGATFYFTLPIVDAQQIEASEMREATATDETILVVAQDLQAANRLLDYLDEQGFTVEGVRAGVGEGWIEQILAFPCQAVIVDCDPATAWGWELVQALRAHPNKHDLPVLFYNLLPTEDKGAFVDLNLLNKPLNLETLIGLLKQVDQAGSNGASPPTVLVVDDEEEILRLHTHMIRERLPQCQVFEAINGRQALALMQQHKPDLVLLDLMMPELDGFGVLEAMQAQPSLRNIPVMILTGQVLPEEVMLRLNRCVSGILAKGLFTVDETLKQIESALARDKRLGSEIQRSVRRTLAYIHAHYADPLSRTDLAAHVGISERYLTQCFRQEVGVTPMEYINRYRVQIAKQLLITSQQNITEIGLQVGFSSSAHFSRVFHQHTGMSPREYVRQHG